MSNDIATKMVRLMVGFEGVRFVIVGVLAAVIHLLVVVAFVSNHVMSPLLANCIGFIVAFHVSFSGHRYFTFPNSDGREFVPYMKWLSVQVSLFLVNEMLYYLFLSMHWPYAISLVAVLILLPLVSFALSKLWVFI